MASQNYPGGRAWRRRDARRRQSAAIDWLGESRFGDVRRSGTIRYSSRKRERASCLWPRSALLSRRAARPARSTHRARRTQQSLSEPAVGPPADSALSAHHLVSRTPQSARRVGHLKEGRRCAYSLKSTAITVAIGP